MRELVVDIVSEGVEATVPATVREMVEAVAGSEEPLSIAQLASLLGLDKSATSRRWQNARARGYLKNLEEKRGKPARIVLGDPLPDDVEILPSPSAARGALQRCSRIGGGRSRTGDLWIPGLARRACPQRRGLGRGRQGALCRAQGAESVRPRRPNEPTLDEVLTRRTLRARPRGHHPALQVLRPGARRPRSRLPWSAHLPLRALPVALMAAHASARG